MIWTGLVGFHIPAFSSFLAQETNANAISAIKAASTIILLDIRPPPLFGFLF
jgi:hypothetical protein